MAHISGFERNQLLLLPEAVDDYVGADNPIRFIDAFVDGLDLVEAGFAMVEAKATGRRGYAPGDLLKLYIYGYLNRVRSSRRLEAECHRNIEIIWLLRTLKPDVKTIADFRADNRAAFKSVFRQFTLLCKRLDMFGRELLAVDGTRITAVNNKDRNFTRKSLEKFIKQADERLVDYLKRLDEGDIAEARMSGSRVDNLAEKIEALRKKRAHQAAILGRLEATGESQISLTDPDCRAMSASGKIIVFPVRLRYPRICSSRRLDDDLVFRVDRHLGVVARLECPDGERSLTYREMAARFCHGGLIGLNRQLGHGMRTRAAGTRLTSRLPYAMQMRKAARSASRLRPIVISFYGRRSVRRTDTRRNVSPLGELGLCFSSLPPFTPRGSWRRSRLTRSDQNVRMPVSRRLNFHCKIRSGLRGGRTFMLGRTTRNVTPPNVAA